MVQPVVIYGSVSCWYHKNRTDDLDRWDDHIDIYTREIFVGQNTKLGNNSNAISKALWMLQTPERKYGLTWEYGKLMVRNGLWDNSRRNQKLK